MPQAVELLRALILIVGGPALVYGQWKSYTALERLDGARSFYYALGSLWCTIAVVLVM